MESNKETKEFNKRYSDYHNIDKNQCYQISNIRNNKNKINHSEKPTTSLNDAGMLNIKYNINEETKKKFITIKIQVFLKKEKYFNL